MRTIHVVDDDQNMRELLGRYLEHEGYRVFLHSNAEEFLPALETQGADLIVLDIMLPGMDGLELCRQLRSKYGTPIIFASARSEEFDRILGIELGGDDYLVKPFSPRELLARIKAIFRRMETSLPSPGSGKTFKDLTIDTAARQVRTKDQAVELTNKEYELLTFLIENAGRAFTREQLITAVWGYAYVGDSRSVDDLVRRIRKKLDGVSAVEISTVWGYGYRIDA
jgi:DNA-binding response OmpR family regulator